MIKIESKTMVSEPPISDILVAYEVDEPKIGEYLAILDRVKNEVLKNTSINEETLKEILFGKED